MKIDSDDFGVFKVKVSYEDAMRWLMDSTTDLEDVNSAIDEAASYAGHNGQSFILIQIAK